MAATNYRVICKTGHTLYLTGVTAVAWASQTVKCEEYRNSFGAYSALNGPGTGSGAGALTTGKTVQVVDSDNLPTTINGTTYSDLLVMDDAMAGISPRTDDISLTMRRYTTADGSYDVPLWNWAGESNETAA